MNKLPRFTRGQALDPSGEIEWIVKHLKNTKKKFEYLKINNNRGKK